MTAYWRCTACPASGTGDRAAEQHTRETCHNTLTRARPWPEQQSAEERQSVRYWLTDKAYDALAQIGATS